MYHARRTLQLAVMPAFLALAVINYFQPSPICTIPGPYGFLTSMWFMSMVMAVAHSGDWFPLVARLLSRSPASGLQSALQPCCDPSLQEQPERQEHRAQVARVA
ncbi:MAG: hypothetical protein ACLQKK_14755 [Rhodomicrobium sp.]